MMRDLIRERNSTLVSMISKDGDSWLCVSPTPEIAIDATVLSFLQVIDSRLFRHVKSPYPRVWWNTGDRGIANIVFRSADRPEKLRGSRHNGVWLDNAGAMSIEAVRTAVATLLGNTRNITFFATFADTQRHVLMGTHGAGGFGFIRKDAQQLVEAIEEEIRSGGHSVDEVNTNG